MYFISWRKIYAGVMNATALVGEDQDKVGKVGIIHTQAFCRTYIDISCVLKPVISVVNFIRYHALNHHQFQALLEEIDCYITQQ